MTDSLANHGDLLNALREAAGARNVEVIDGELPFLFVHGIEVPELERVVSEAGDPHLAVAPVFGGLCVAPSDYNPLLERLELNRAGHLETSRRRREHLAELHTREREIDELLRRLAGSRTLRLAGLLSRLRGRGRLTFSVDRIRRVLGD